MTTSRTTVAPLLGLAAAALLFVVPQSARAQGLILNSGDAVTVSGAGTVGKIGSTTYLPGQNTTTSYSGALAGVQTNGTSAFTLGTGSTLTAGQSGIGLFAHGSGPITVTGGTSTGGKYGYGLYANDSSPVTISGGTFTAGLYGTGLGANSSSPVTISGGTIIAGQNGIGLYASNSGLVTITGGTISGGLFNNGATVDLFGTSFSYTVNGTKTSIVSGTLPSDSEDGVSGTLSGILFNGDLFNTTFTNLGTLEVNVGTPPVLPAAAPEPSQFAALAIGLLGLGALALKARKRQAA